MVDGPRHGPRVARFVLPVCLAIQACLLFARLDLLPIWGDEHFTLRAASGSAMQALRVISAEKNNPPLHTLLVHLWLLIPWPVSKIVAARGLSVLFALASTVVMDRLWLKSSSARVRVCFLALWTLSPCLLLYSRIARPYSLLVLGFIVVLRAAVELLSRPSDLPRILLFGAGLAALLYVHYLAGLALLCGVLLVLVWRAARRRQPAVLAPAAGVILVAAALYWPWLPNLWVALGRLAIAPPVAPGAGGWISELVRPGYLLFSLSLGETPPLWVLTGAVLAIPGLVYLVWRGARLLPEWLTPLALAAVTGYAAAGRWVSFVFTPGRLLFLLPFFLLLAAAGAERSSKAGWLVWAGTLCLSVGSIVGYFSRTDFLNKAYLLPYGEIADIIGQSPRAAKVALIADSCNTDPSPLFDLVPEQVARILVTRQSTLDSLREQLAATGAGVVWYFRNTHDTSPGGLSGVLEQELVAGRRVRRLLFVPYSRRDRWFQRLLGWQERPTHFVQLLEIQVG